MCVMNCSGSRITAAKLLRFCLADLLWDLRYILRVVIPLKPHVQNGH